MHVLVLYWELLVGVIGGSDRFNSQHTTSHQLTLPSLYQACGHMRFDLWEGQEAASLCRDKSKLSFQQLFPILKQGTPA